MSSTISFFFLVRVECPFWVEVVRAPAEVIVRGNLINRVYDPVFYVLIIHMVLWRWGDGEAPRHSVY